MNAVEGQLEREFDSMPQIIHVVEFLLLKRGVSDADKFRVGLQKSALEKPSGNSASDNNGRAVDVRSN